MHHFRKRWWGRYFLASLFLIGCMVTACGTKTSVTAIEQSDEVAIYAAVVRQIYVEDDTFGGTLQPPNLYIIRYTNDKAGDPMGKSGESLLLSESVQSEVRTALQDLPAEIIWVDTRENVELDSNNGRVVGGGAIIGLGNIYLQEDGSAQVSGSIYVANLAAGGQTYNLAKTDGRWEIIGTTGIMWIS